ncbi:MAG: lamin tail domain-containing protein [Saprospiraceae bacterium]
MIDSFATLINEAKSREEERWGTIGMHQDTIKAMKTWLRQRIPWMSNQLGSFNTCSNISTPPIVISRINFHPATSINFADEDKLEFIELSNAGVATVNLSGLYLGGSGLVFQFPNNSSLPGGASIFLASDAATFTKKYKVLPY